MGSDRKQLKATREKLWNRPGFQRVLGGYWFNYVFNLGVLVFGLIVMAVIFPNYILPFPEAMGFRSVVTSLFALMFTLFDVGIGSAVTRFVAEHVGRGHIRKSIEYLRFFIYFQMFTGLIQITIIAVWALNFAASMTNFAPLIWMFLIYSTIQFPGMLGIYNSGLAAFQRFDKKNIVSFVQTVVFEMTTQVVFIFIGRWWGIQNPQYGELMGATLGYIIGLYIDDFLAMLLSARYFSQVLAPFGISIWETLIPSFDKVVVRESMIFGLKNMAQGIFYQISMLMITAMTIVWLPNYATVIGLFNIADTIARIVIQDLPTTAAISEAYNTGKKQLTDYYIQATFKWYGILTIFLAVEVFQLVPPMISKIAGSYAGAAWMIPYLLASRVLIGPIHFSDGVQQGCDKPEYAAYSLAVQMIARAIAFYFMLAPNMLPSMIEGYNTAIAYLLADLPSVLAKNVFAWWLIDRKLIKVRVNWWQTLGAPSIAVLPLIPVNNLLLMLFNQYASNLWVAVALAIFFLIFLLFIAPSLFLFPMLGLIGGWDSRGLQHLKEAAEISGPSRFLTLALYRGAKWGHDHSPFQKFGEKLFIPYEEADREAAELYAARMQALEISNKS
jgi:O-antigen/teichoic acid export membrane protein